jgi:hypothetical protein
MHSGRKKKTDLNSEDYKCTKPWIIKPGTEETSKLRAYECAWAILEANGHSRHLFTTVPVVSNNRDSDKGESTKASFHNCKGWCLAFLPTCFSSSHHFWTVSISQNDTMTTSKLHIDLTGSFFDGSGRRFLSVATGCHGLSS